MNSKPLSNHLKLFIHTTTYLLLVVGSLLSLPGCKSGGGFNQGDSLYIDAKYKDGLVNLRRLVRPMTEQDVDSMDISTGEKQALKLKLDPTAKPYLILANASVKPKTECLSIGRVIDDAQTLDLYLDSEKKMIKDEVITFHPNECTLTLEQDGIHHMPPNYTWADNNYYIGTWALASKSSKK